MDIGLPCERASRFALVPVVVVIGQMELQVAVRCADEIGLVIAFIVAIAVGEVETTLEIACTIAACLIRLSRIADRGLVEFAVVNPASLDRCRELGALLHALHADTVLGNIAESDVADLKALAQCRCSRFCHEVEAPAVNDCIRADALDGDILAGFHSCHEAVVADRAAEVRGIVGSQTGRGFDIADDAHNKGCAVLRQLLDDAAVGVGLAAAVGCLAAADILTCGVQDIADTGDLGAVLSADRDGVLVVVGDIEDDGTGFERSAVGVCAYTVSILEMGISRTILCIDLEPLLDDGALGGGEGDGIGTCGNAGNIHPQTCARITYQIGQIIALQRAGSGAAVGNAGHIGILDTGIDHVKHLVPAARTDDLDAVEIDIAAAWIGRLRGGLCGILFAGLRLGRIRSHRRTALSCKCHIEQVHGICLGQRMAAGGNIGIDDTVIGGQFLAVEIHGRRSLGKNEGELAGRGCIEADGGRTFHLEALCQRLAVIGDRTLGGGQVARDGVEAAGSAVLRKVVDICRSRNGGLLCRLCCRLRLCLSGLLRGIGWRRCHGRCAVRGIGEAGADRNDLILVGDQCCLELRVHMILCIINRIIEIPLEVAALYTSGICHDLGGNILRCIRRVAVHDAGIGIEVVIGRTAAQRLDRGRHLLGAGGCDIHIKATAVVGISHKRLGTDDLIAIRLDDAAGLAGENSAALGALSGDQERISAVAEVVVLCKAGSPHRHADAILGVAVEIIVVGMNRTGADTGMTGVGMVIPVVVIGDIILCRFRFHALQIALSAIPEMVKGVRDIAGGLGIQCAVALCLVRIGTGIAVKHVTVMHPDVVIACREADIIALGGIAVHKADVSDLYVGAFLDDQTKAVEGRICADAFDGQTAGHGIHIEIAARERARIRDVADKADADRTGLGIAFQIGDDVLDACDCRGCALLVRKRCLDAVLGRIRDIDHGRIAFQRAILIVSAGRGTLHPAEAAPVMCNGCHLRFTGLGRILLAADHGYDLECVAACLQTGYISTEAACILTDEHTVNLLAVSVDIVAVCTGNGLPLRIGSLGVARGSRHGHGCRACCLRRDTARQRNEAGELRGACSEGCHNGCGCQKCCQRSLHHLCFHGINPLFSFVQQFSFDRITATCTIAVPPDTNWSLYF